jgi:hypothetical protein
MIRRATAFLTFFLVISLSFQARVHVCPEMAHATASHSDHPESSQGHDHGPTNAEHRNHSPDGSAPPGHCQAAVSCAGIAVTPSIIEITPTDPRPDGIASLEQIAPAALTLDLDTPPPKA